MDNKYTYDAVDNVLKVVNNAPLPTEVNGMGGQMEHNYTYDGLYRLTGAGGTYKGTGDRMATYGLTMTYDNLHNITFKSQHIHQNGVQFDDELWAGYTLNYAYNPDKPHQIASLQDNTYQAETGDNTTMDYKHQYEYDANGNLVYINTGRKKEDGSRKEKSREKKYLWDEENRLTAINDNGFISNYTYDAGGERVVKLSGENEGLFVNAALQGSTTTTNRFTAYVNPYLVVSPGGRYTKHIYIGNQRIVSKLGDLESFGQDPRRTEYAGHDIEKQEAKPNYEEKYSTALNVIKAQYDTLGLTFKGKDNSDYQNGQNFCCTDDGSSLRSGNIVINSSDDFESSDEYAIHF